jgi:hypothetical protein
MQKYEYININLKNNIWAKAKNTTHRDIIDDHVRKGFRYVGFIPCLIGAGGKILNMDLIFEKDEK